MSMGKESGKITSDIEEILRICTDFYKSLFNQMVPALEFTMKSSPDTDEIPESTEEVERMKRHKAHSMDELQLIL